MGILGAISKPSWDPLESFCARVPLENLLGASWGPLGGSREPLSRSWAALGSLLAALGPLRSALGHSEAAQWTRESVAIGGHVLPMGMRRDSRSAGSITQ